MIKSIKNKFLLALVAGTMASVGSVFAADGPTPTPKQKTTTPTAGTPVVVTGKIVQVDKFASTLTVEVDGELKQLAVGPRVKMVNSGKLVTLDQLLVGSEVAVLTRPGSNNSLQVVALSVEASPTPEIPAGPEGQTAPDAPGAGNSKGASNGRGGGLARTPFATLANPANNLGPVISPSK